MSAETDIQFEVWQDGHMVASADSLSDAQHFMVIYGQDGPVEAKTAVTTRTPGFNVRTPAPEGEACPHDAYETDAAGQPVRCVDCGMAIASAASPVVPAPEGEAWRTVPVEPTEAMIKAANALWGEGTGVNYVQLEPEDFYAAMLAAAPVVPVGSGEPVARATCQDCGGHIEGWICQSCARQFRENDAGNLVFEDQPVVPVGVSREKIVRLLDALIPETLSDENGNAVGVSFAAKDLKAKTADAIITALRPTDTGANHD